MACSLPEFVCECLSLVTRLGFLLGQIAPPDEFDLLSPFPEVVASSADTCASGQLDKEIFNLSQLHSATSS